MKNTFSYIAAAGLILSIVVHLLSLFGIDVSGPVPFVWMLHLGIFVVWFPAILELRKNQEIKEIKAKSGINPIKFYSTIFKGIPKPLMYFMIFILVYATLNFFFFMKFSGGGGPGIQNGKYVIENHGTILKEITESQYFSMKANEIRGFSGVWMVFYSFALGILWPKTQTEKNAVNSL